MEIADAEQPQVGGHTVAGLQQHDVAGDERLGGHALLFPIAAHRRLRGDHACERFDGGLRFRFLEKADDGVHEHDAEDDRRIHPFAQHRRDAAREKENIDERLVELSKKPQPSRRAAPRREAIRAGFLLPPLHFRCGEAIGQIHAEQLHDFIGG